METYNKYKEGDYAKVVKDTAAHNQQIGQYVKVVFVSNTGVDAIGENGEKWSYYFEDITPLKLVSRRAVEGEKILIVDGDINESDYYKNGDIFKCTDDDGAIDDVPTEITTGGITYWLFQKEYKVFEDLTLCDVVNTSDKIFASSFKDTPLVKALSGVGEALSKLESIKPCNTPDVFEIKVTKELDQIKELLIAKNKKYGNSALQPSNIFSKVNAKEGLLIRIDDKLKRVSNGSYLEGDEDVVKDLIGYLVMLRIVDNE